MSKYQRAIEAFDEYRKIVESWNAQADAYNQWDNLEDQEKIEWALNWARVTVVIQPLPDNTQPLTITAP